MAKKKPQFTTQGEQLVLQRIGQMQRDDSVDWSLVRDMDLGELVPAIIAADAGLMIRAASQRSALAIGLYVGGQNVWVTATDPSAAVAVLREITANLEDLVGSKRAPEAAGTTVRPRKARS